jgi:hypothetical protein
MIPGISLGSDSLGLGGIFQGIGTARSSSAVEGCGNRPLFGKEAKQAYNDCLARNQELKSQQIGANANLPVQTPPNNTLIIAIVAVVVVVVLVVVLKK